MPFRLTMQNYKSLRRFSWSPDGVCVLVGPNGAGKTTALWTLEVLRLAVESDYVHALTYVGGRSELRHWDAPAEEPIEITLSVDDATWTIRPAWSTRLYERFTVAGQESFACDGDQVRYGAFTLDPGDHLALTRMATTLRATNRERPTREKSMLDFIRGYRVHGDHELRQLRENGSPMSSDDRLNSAGTNVFSVLQRWRDVSEDEHRWTFVNERLARAFPSLFRRFDFDSAANVVSATIRTPSGRPVRPNDWPNGFFAVLLHLCAIAGTDPRGAVAIDEPETSLHPALIRFVVECFRDWSAKYDVTVLLATHSPVLLDCFNEAPDQVFVMEPGQETLPVQLDQLKDRDWLAHFALGTLYEDLRFGAPVDGTPT